ncbi:hypothetical protein [Pseudoxanthomonas sp.]|uniref:hypothetical protein n=1 Tax=Pseudoxanthomonas sp. TaxID=1871049 RepID=UPI0026356BAA|nr:hypothetical protein [Pseudoxanthomonas sp.]WDS37229.1 MAG: hypothetical protein O8I58_04885 [Pseudoxanthomonas sp.]
MWAHHVATKAIVVPLLLEVGQSVEIPIFRLRPSVPQLELWFERGQAPRPELGEWSSNMEAEDGRALFFDAPGSRVLLRVRTSSSVEILEALPVGGQGADILTRGLVRFVDDGDAHRFSWPDAAAPNSLPRGHSRLSVSVLDVGDAIRGERIELCLQSAMGFKVSDPGYAWLWIFFFWPVLVVLLLLAGLPLVLLSRSTRFGSGGDAPAQD